MYILSDKVIKIFPNNQAMTIIKIKYQISEYDKQNTSIIYEDQISYILVERKGNPPWNSSSA